MDRSGDVGVRVSTPVGVPTGADAARPWTPVDPVGDLLADLRIHGTFYCRSEATAPWGVEMPAFPGCMAFHVVTRGTVVLEVGGEQLTLGVGDLALVPHGRGHLLRSAVGAPVAGRADLLPQQQVGEHYSVLRLDGGGAAAGMVCGVVEPARPGAAHLLDLLPPVLVVDGRDPRRGGWLPLLLQVISDEAAEDRPGAEAVITRLADVVVLQAVRTWLDTAATGPGWLRALRDPQVGQAVALLHREPGAAWTLTRLAREARMSRSSFAARFTELAGEPVMRYLARWRMHLATVALAEGAQVGQLAGRLGYESEAAFSRAYKRIVGVPPTMAGQSTR
ncbi:AraC family transcriptional regulator [Geodermatophilus sp. SYSU D01106]